MSSHISKKSIFRRYSKQKRLSVIITKLFSVAHKDCTVITGSLLGQDEQDEIKQNQNRKSRHGTLRPAGEEQNEDVRKGNQEKSRRCRDGEVW